jgi:hypothetical protein
MLRDKSELPEVAITMSHFCKGDGFFAFGTYTDNKTLLQQKDYPVRRSLL